MLREGKKGEELIREEKLREGKRGEEKVRYTKNPPTLSSLMLTYSRRLFTFIYTRRVSICLFLQEHTLRLYLLAHCCANHVDATCLFYRYHVHSLNQSNGLHQLTRDIVDVGAFSSIARCVG